MASIYKIQIIDNEGNVAHSWVPGSEVEQEFTQNLINHVASKGIGFWKTEAQVKEKAKLAIDEFLHNLKSAVKPEQ